MTRLAVLAVLFAAAPLFGQTKEVIEEVDTLLAQARIAQRHAEERNEDIEVLRRLLNKAFGFDHKTAQLAEPLQPYQYLGSTTQPLGGSGIFSGSGWPTGQPGGSTGFAPQPHFGSGQSVTRPFGKHISQAVGPFDGVYLKGSGVVFTLRVPKEEMQFGHGLCVGSADKNLGLGSSCTGCHNDLKAAHKDVVAAAANDCQKCHSTDVSSKLTKPVSDWDRIRADVRGEKLPAAPSVAADPKKARVVMCKPGDLRELIVGQLHLHAKNLRNLDKNDWVTVVITFDEAPGAKASRIPAPTDKPGFTPDELQSITLGDLHLKQGKYTEAAIAYEKGLFRFRDGVVRLTFPPTVPAAEVQKVIAEMEKNARALYKSLATAYLHLNDVEGARTALDKATTLKVEVAAADAGKPKPVVPAKLVLAVAKSDLDRNPKYEDLRKGAHLELIGFPADAEKK